MLRCFLNIIKTLFKINVHKINEFMLLNFNVGLSIIFEQELIKPSISSKQLFVDQFSEKWWIDGTHSYKILVKIC